MRLPPAIVPLVALLCAQAALTSSAARAAPRTLASLLPHEARLVVPGSGPCRVEIPASVRDRLAPDLRDLLVVDARGAPVRHAIVWESTPDAPTVLRVPAEHLEVRRHTVRGETHPPRHVETFTLAAPAPRALGEGWFLVVDAAAPELVRTVRVTAFDADGRALAVVETSVFRLPGAERRTLRLPADAWTRLEVRFEGEGGYLRPQMRFESSESSAHAPFLIVDGSDGPSRILFGGGRIRHPPEGGQLALPPAVRRGASLQRGTLGPTHANPAYDPAPALAHAHSPGRPIQPTGFTHRAPLEVPRSRDGLVRFLLPPELLAAARSDLGDVRVVDLENRQWPHRARPSPEVTTSPLALEGMEVQGTRSIHRLGLVAPGLPVHGLRIAVARGVVERDALVRATDASGRSTVRAIHLSRLPGEDAVLEVRFPSLRASELALEVDDGDAGPLEIAEAEALSPTVEIELLAPAGAYRVLAGRADAAPPRYDLAGIGPLLDGIDGPTLRTAPTEPTPDHVPPVPPPEAFGRVALFTALALGFLLLGALTLRLAGEERDERAEGDPPDET